MNTIYNTSEYLTGQAQKNASVTVKIDSKNYATTVGSDGKFKVTIPKQKVDKNIEIYVTDSSKNKSPVTTVKVVKDITAPFTPKVQIVYSNSTIVQGVAEAKASIEVKINKIVYKGVANSNGTYSIRIPKQNINTIVYVYAIDSGNNRSKVTQSVVKNYLVQYFSKYKISDGRSFFVNKKVYTDNGYWKRSMIFAPYIVNSLKKSNMYFEAGFEQDNWVFFKQIKIVADGHTYTKSFDLFDVKRNVFMGGIKEYITFKPDATLISFLKKYVLNGKKVTVYFEGTDYNTAFVLSGEEKQAISETLKYVGY